MEAQTNIKNGNRKKRVVAVCVLTAGWLVMSVNAEDKQSKKTQQAQRAVSQSVSSAEKPEAKRSVATRKQKFYPVLTPFEQKFQEKLSEKVDFDFIETPLEDVVQHFQKFSGASFVVLKNDLEGQGVTLEEPITLRMPDISFQSALALVLNPLELSYAVEKDFIKVSTVYELEETLKTRVYPVGDYCQSPADYVVLEQAIKNASLGKWRAQINPFAPSSGTQSGAGRGLFQIIKGSTGGLGAGGLGGTSGDWFGAPPGYEEGLGGTISVVPQSKSLVISQTYQSHVAITELLNQLRQARAED